MSDTEKQATSGHQEEAVDQEKQAEETTAAHYEDLDREALIALIQERTQQLEKSQKQQDETKNALLRKAAELDNYRKRVKRERDQIYVTAKASAVEDFLSISDDLSRSLQAADELNVDATFLDGVTLVANKFDEVLNKHGVERIDQEDVPFNVDFHDALMRQKPEDETIESDTVLKVIENGYKIGDRVIRHAKVIVSE